MGALRASLIKELRRYRRDPLGLAAWIGIPVFLAVLLVLLFGRESPTPHGRVLVADQDDSFVSRLLIGAYSGGPLAEMLAVEAVSEEEGRRRMDRGEASALVIIPEGFGRSFFDRTPAKVEIVTNPAQSIVPRIVVETTAAMLDLAGYFQEAFADELERLPRGEAPSDEQVAAVAVTVNRVVRQSMKYLDPPLIEIEAGAAAEEEPVNWGALFFPSMLYMAVLLAAGGMSYDIWREKQMATLHRAASAPGSFAALLGGKLAAAVAVFLALGAGGLLAGAGLLGLEVRRPLLAVLWIGLSGGALYLLSMVLQVHSSNYRSAAIGNNLAVMLLALIGGSFFPFELMPDWMARIGRMTPNGWALLQLRDLLSGAPNPASAAGAFSAVVGVGLLSWWICLRRLRRGFSR